MFGKAYWFLNRWIWRHLPSSVRLLPLTHSYGMHLHALVRLRSGRKQYFGTFFLRNRPELELMCLLLDQKSHGSNLAITVLACSKGAEVYSIAWAIRTARPDLKLNLQAVDISQDILEFAEKGIYSVKSPEALTASNSEGLPRKADVSWNTSRDQNASIFERMTDEELGSMCEVEGDQARIKPWLKGGIVWLRGDAGDPGLVRLLGPQDIVVANRFLCHMEPEIAEACLDNIGRLVKPGGYLFVSGVDVDVRTKVAQEMGWRPIPELIREIHEGDPSLRRDWPLEYWGLEPFQEDRPDWKNRYASVFQLNGSEGTGRILDA